MTVTTQREECTATVGGRLPMSMELGRRQWKLGFPAGMGQLRYTDGERTVWRIVRVPTEADEQRRQRHRELFTLKQDRTRVTNRIAGLLATVGGLLKVDAKFGVRLGQLRQWNGQPGAPS